MIEHSLLPTLPIVLALLATFVVVGLYSMSETFPIEVVSLWTLTLLLVSLSLFPLRDSQGSVLLESSDVLRGFSSPALMTIAAFLVIGQGLMQTGSLDRLAQKLFALGTRHWHVTVGLVLLLITMMSGFLNNTPIVVIFIPIMQALANRFDQSPSLLMMPMSFAAILGGMTTLIGSSTNILVSSSLQNLGFRELSFFEFTVPGVILAGTGFLYLVLIAPRLLTERATMATDLFREENGKPFLAQITIPAKSKLIGEVSSNGSFPSLKDVRVRMILRGEHSEVPPYREFALEAGDVLVISATNKALAELTNDDNVILGEGYLESFRFGEGHGDETGRMISEVMVLPASILIGMTLERMGFRYRFGGIVLGLRRRARILSRRLTEIPLEAGDILLVMARTQNIRSIPQKAPQDLLVIERSAIQLPNPMMARRAFMVMFGTVGLIVSNILPIVAAAVLGAVVMLALKVVRPNQAMRALDRKLILLIATALALGTVLERTGAAEYLAHILVYSFSWLGPVGMLSVFFLFVAILTNLISNNACALIFTPIAVNIATSIGVDPIIFAIAVIFAANCCFITPIGYQTNLLVMGPGHYRFKDFMNVGLPLAGLIWLAFTLFVPWYYGLW